MYFGIISLVIGMKNSFTKSIIYSYYDDEIILQPTYYEGYNDENRFSKNTYYPFWNVVTHEKMASSDFIYMIRSLIKDGECVVDFSYSDDVLFIEIQRNLSDFEVVRDEFQFVLNFCLSDKKDNFINELKSLDFYYRLMKSNLDIALDKKSDPHFMYLEFDNLFRKFNLGHEIEFDSCYFSIEEFVEFCEFNKQLILNRYFKENKWKFRKKHIKEYLFCSTGGAAIGGAISLLCYSTAFLPGFSTVPIVSGATANLLIRSRDIDKKIYDNISIKFDEFIKEIKSKYFVMGYEDGYVPTLKS